jgi:hypothetical protein
MKVTVTLDTDDNLERAALTALLGSSGPFYRLRDSDIPPLMRDPEGPTDNEVQASEALGVVPVATPDPVEPPSHAEILAEARRASEDNAEALAATLQDVLSTHGVSMVKDLCPDGRYQLYMALRTITKTPQ